MANSAGHSTALAMEIHSVDGPWKAGIIKRLPVVGDNVRVAIKFSGVCHTDIHLVRGHWGNLPFPVTPGHELVGLVEEVGDAVTKFQVGQRVAVGCFIDSCLDCEFCKRGEENICAKGAVMTYGTPLPDGTLTKGGYASHIVVREHFVLRLPEGLDMAAAAPLLCAGVTMWTPLVNIGVKTGMKVGIHGLGGLGHMGVKLAAALGAETYVISRTDSKRDVAKSLGAKDVILSTDPSQLDSFNHSFDLIIDTVGHHVTFPKLLGLLKNAATLHVVGGHPEPLSIRPNVIFRRNLTISGSLVGGLSSTQEMLDFCAKHNIVSDIELVECSYVEKAYERIQKSDVRFRFVLDIEGSLSGFKGAE